MEKPTTEILVRLLDEGTDVWRPTPARPLGSGVFEVLGPTPPDEHWEFESGAEVICESRRIEAETRLVAARRLLSGWSVWRQDDHGSRFEIRRGLSHAGARRLADDLEAGAHKQSYWVRPTGSRE